MLVKPYFVKLTNKRWYGIVRKPVEDGWMFVLAFDRVLSLELTTEKFRYPKGFDPVGFFSNNYGILWVEDTPVEKVTSGHTASRSIICGICPCITAKRKWPPRKTTPTSSSPCVPLQTSTPRSSPEARSLSAVPTVAGRRNQEAAP